MLVFFEERLAFLSVPKTGSTAYQAALRPHADFVVADPPELKHAPLYRYDRFFRPIFEKVCGVEMETLAVMREPISWLGSWYRYRRRDFMRGKPNNTHDVDFDGFVNAYLKGDTPGFANVGRQSKFLEPRPKGAPITHLFRYEDPDRLDAFLAQRLGREVQTGRANVSPQMDLQLSPGVERRLRAKFHQDFDLYASLS